MAGVASKNPFDFLGEDGDDSVLSEPTPAPEPKRPSEKAAGPKDGGAPMAATPQQPSGVEARMRSTEGRGRGPRGGRGGRGGRGRGPEGGGDVETTQNGFPEGDGGRGRGRGGGGRGFARGGRGEDHRRRQYDRYDVSGRSHETEKRHGAGKGNWGNDADDIAAGDAEAPPATEAPPTPEPEAEAPAPATGGGDWDAAEPAEEEAKPEEPAAAAATEEIEPASAVVEPEEPVVPEKPQMTLDEWEAMQKEKRGAAKPYKAMVVNKEDFSDYTAFTRKDRTADDAVLKLSTQKTKAAQKERERKAKEILETGFRINSEDGGRSGGRGGRGGRGRGPPEGGYRGNDAYPGDSYRPRETYRENERAPFPRGGGRGRDGGGRGREGGRGRGSGAAPQINDEAAFPGLA